MNTYWEKFNSMGTEIILTANLEEGEEKILMEAKEFICDFSDRFSRFISDNELWKLNHADGRKISVSPMMREMLLDMQKFYILTDGIFDPTVIGALEDAGYDQTFILIEKEKKVLRKIKLEEIIKHHFARVPFSKLEIFSDAVRPPKGFRADTGGNGKGFIVDRVAEEFFSGVKNFWISAGGDIFLSGNSEGAVGWQVAVENPLFPKEKIFTLKTNGEKMGIATSGIIKRKGEKDGEPWHHLIDPRSGRPAKNDILSVTVKAENTSRADIFAKAVLILGQDDGLEFIEKQSDAECIIFFKNKAPYVSRKMYKYIK